MLPLVRDALAARGDFQEMRRHLGFETQRQWFDTVIQCTAAALLGCSRWSNYSHISG